MAFDTFPQSAAAGRRNAARPDKIVGAESAFPNAARVIFGTGDDGVALVVERSREDLVRVPLKDLHRIGREGVEGEHGVGLREADEPTHLQAVARLDIPHAARAVAGRRNDLVALRVE